MIDLCKLMQSMNSLSGDRQAVFTKNFNTNWEAVICDVCGITPKILKSNSKKREAVIGRYIAMTYIKNSTNTNLTTIGQMFRTNHSTALRALKKHSFLLERGDKDYSKAWEEFKNRI